MRACPRALLREEATLCRGSNRWLIACPRSLGMIRKVLTIRICRSKLRSYPVGNALQTPRQEPDAWNRLSNGVVSRSLSTMDQPRGVTERVLDRLAERGILSTFFVIGNRLRTGAARELSERARGEGHWIGNHTLTHSVQFGESTPAFAISEIDGAQAATWPARTPPTSFSVPSAAVGYSVHRCSIRRPWIICKRLGSPACSGTASRTIGRRHRLAGNGNRPDR